jgi:hypothetical protein
MSDHYLVTFLDGTLALSFHAVADPEARRSRFGRLLT